MNKKAHLPNWEELVLSIPTMDGAHKFVSPVQKLKEEKSLARLQPYLRLIAKTLGLVTRGSTFPNLLTNNWDDLVDLASEQVGRNIAFSKRAKNSAPELFLHNGLRSSSTRESSFNQLPCTRMNLRERVAKIQALVHDLNQAPTPALQKNYALIFMAPPCNTEGVILFLNAALNFTKNVNETTFLLCTHLMSQLRTGLESLEQFLTEKSLEVLWFKPAFAVYPIPKSVGLMASALRILLGTALLSTDFLFLKQMTPQFFISDALCLKRREN